MHKYRPFIHENNSRHSFCHIKLAIHQRWFFFFQSTRTAGSNLQARSQTTVHSSYRRLKNPQKSTRMQLTGLFSDLKQLRVHQEIKFIREMQVTFPEPAIATTPRQPLLEEARRMCESTFWKSEWVELEFELSSLRKDLRRPENWVSWLVTAAVPVREVETTAIFGCL